MDEKDKLDVTDTFVPYDQHTSRTKMLQSLSTVLQEDAGDSESVKERPGTARNPAVKPRVSWTRRVLSWFERD
jgi:hypothetical protein